VAALSVAPTCQRVQMRAAAPIGRSRAGLTASSAIDATMSKPMKLKKTDEAPAKMPCTRRAQPNG